VDDERRGGRRDRGACHARQEAHRDPGPAQQVVVLERAARAALGRFCGEPARARQTSARVAAAERCMSTTEALNHRQWPADRRGVYEVWYLTWNHAATGQGFWLRYISESPDVGEPRGELWF